MRYNEESTRADIADNVTKNISRASSIPDSTQDYMYNRRSNFSRFILPIAIRVQGESNWSNYFYGLHVDRFK